MPALFAPSASADDLVPLAQLGAGPDGTAVLARKGDQLVELVQLAFGPGSPRWPALETRLRAIAAVEHPAVRGVLGLDADPPTVTLEGDSAPPLAELLRRFRKEARVHAKVGSPYIANFKIGRAHV